MAEEALRVGEVPVGCVFVKDNQVSLVLSSRNTEILR